MIWMEMSLYMLCGNLRNIKFIMMQMVEVMPRKLKVNIMENKNILVIFNPKKQGINFLDGQ